MYLLTHGIAGNVIELSPTFGEAFPISDFLFKLQKMIGGALKLLKFLSNGTPVKKFENICCTVRIIPLSFVHVVYCDSSESGLL